jgi:predicted RNase H-like HicB family nuclease
MKRAYTSEYWKDDGWYVGRIKEVPSVFSQGETLQELEANVKDAYLLMFGENQVRSPNGSRRKELVLDV